MVKFLKPGKVAIVLSGRYAGKKVVIVKVYDDGTKDRQYGHAIVAGIEKYPLKVTKKMGQKRVNKRSRIKPFIKVINYNHLMPTRYTFELEEIKQILTADCLKLKDPKETKETKETKDPKEPSQREAAKKAIKKILQERYKTGKNRWFFTKLRF